MKTWLTKWWKSYKYRFVPWIALNVKKYPSSHNQEITKVSLKQRQSQGESKEELSFHTQVVQNIKTEEAIPVEHVSKSKDNLILDAELQDILINFFKKCQYPKKNTKHSELEIISQNNQYIMKEHFGFSIKRCKSIVSPEAGTGVFVTSGFAKAGSVIGIALYPGTIYMPYEPLFFPSLGNPFIFRCSDGVHVDGNDRWISKSIFNSCAARDKFDFDTPCCDSTWLTSTPLNPMNVGQYVNNRSRSLKNNVVYQECQLLLPPNSLVSALDNYKRISKACFPIELFRWLPNVWSDPNNNRFGLKVIPLVAIRDIHEGEEILSSYFTVVHSEGEEKTDVNSKA